MYWLTEKGPKAAELAYRGTPPFRYEGEVRGNSAINDIYFFSGIKIAVNLGNILKKRLKKIGMEIYYIFDFNFNSIIRDVTSC